jgi:hypothetical protein
LEPRWPNELEGASGDQFWTVKEHRQGQWKKMMKTMMAVLPTMALMMRKRRRTLSD